MPKYIVKTSLISVDALVGNLSTGFPNFDSFLVVSVPTEELSVVREHVNGLCDHISKCCGFKIGVLAKDMTKMPAAENAMFGEIFRYVYYVPAPDGTFKMEEEQMLGISSVLYDFVESTATVLS